jgi:uncharacterized protein (TIGR03083 family)
MQTIGSSEAVDALAAQYAVFEDVLASVDDDELLLPSGCRGWTNCDLVFHMLLDAQRALVTFNSPSPGPADSDAVTYWRGFSASDQSAVAHARFVRISAAAHSHPRVIVNRWRETATAAARCSRTNPRTDFVTTQGLTLRTPDFISTLVVEAVVHHLDLIINLHGKPGPVAPALSITVRTVEGLLGRPPPTMWDEVTYILKATGRSPLTEEERHALSDAAHKIPVFS